MNSDPVKLDPPEPDASGFVLRTMERRRSIYTFSPRPVEEESLRKALRVAVSAPNHRLTRPWRFSVFLGPGRLKLADALVAAAGRMGASTDKARRTALAPALICVGVSPQLERPRVIEREEILAVGAATQNLILALHALGIGSWWTTGAAADTPEVRELLGLTGANDRVIGIILVGYPSPDNRVPERQLQPEQFTTWHREK